jgi:RNA polymerase sigma-70 factor (ECF subfamily)
LLHQIFQRIDPVPETFSKHGTVNSPLHTTPRADDPSDDGAVTFDEVYDRYFPFVWRCLRHLGVAAAALDDAAQDVFLVVHRRLPTLRQQSSVRAWLFAIVRNVASNHRRVVRRKGTEPAPLDGDVMAHPAAGPLERAQDAEAAAFIQEFLERINERKRSVFVLAVIEEMSIPEVAATLSIPLNTAYTRLRSVRADFQRALLAKGRSP